MDILNGDDPQVGPVHRGGDEERGEEGEVVPIDEDWTGGKGFLGGLRHHRVPPLDVLVEEPPAGLGQALLSDSSV
ncbi:MAG: hypothetical protein N2320_01745 [Candidatus Bipolaricaulota bacterium]|nr:hypothetical protein [Candidatus Bipolaricaulota bacterium]